MNAGSVILWDVVNCSPREFKIEEGLPPNNFWQQGVISQKTIIFIGAPWKSHLS